MSELIEQENLGRRAKTYGEVLRDQARVPAPAGKMSPDTLKDIAQENCHVALNALTEVAESGQSESARINAANAILDRAHGKVQADQPASAAITIVINKFNNSEPEMITIDQYNAPERLET